MRTDRSKKKGQQCRKVGKIQGGGTDEIKRKSWKEIMREKHQKKGEEREWRILRNRGMGAIVGKHLCKRRHKINIGKERQNPIVWIRKRIHVEKTARASGRKIS